MLGLFLIYFIWKKYSDLALDHDKSKWGYGLLGIACYYGSTIIVGIIIGIVSVATESNFLEETNDFILGLIALPFGLLSVWGLYKILENKWAKTSIDSENGTLDGDLIQSSTKDL
jgi:hypothetical protein